MNDPGGRYLHLNRDGRWPGFAWRALEAGPDGRLSLASLPSLAADSATAAALAALGAPDGPAGLAIAPDNAVLWTDPTTGRLFRRDPCDGHRGPAPLDPDAGLEEPRALAVHVGRKALIVADARRHRLVLVDLGTYQVVDVWGGPGTAPGRFDRPTGLAVDAEGAVYVADAGNRRIQKLDRFGTVDPGFAAAVAAAAPGFQRPETLAFDADRLWVLDPAARILSAFDASGDRRAELSLSLVAPAGLLAMAGALHVGDNARRRLVRLDATGGHALGEARGFEGPVAALAATGDALWLHPGGASLPVRLERRGAAVRQGVLWGGPIALGGEPHAWQRLSALGDASGGRVVFFVHAGDGAGPPAPDPGRLGEPTGGFDPPAWRAIGEGAPDVWVRETSERLWIGALLSGDGQQAPYVEQLRLSFDDDGYAHHLPAIYRVPAKVSAGAPPASRETLERFLALFEGFFDDTDDEIAGLARLFDPASVPESWLAWLAGWLAFPLEEGWPSAKKRRLLAEAFEAYAWRGTSRGLARALADRLGVVASVEEPHAQTDWWVLPPGDAGACSAGSSVAGRSRLGLTTRLAPAAAQGAVVGSTAILDRSHVIEEEDVGEPLFTPTAYQFSVVLPRSQASAPATLERIRQLIEREKPAHVAYEICLVDPGIRVGHQALLGIDTVLGGTGPAPATRLGEPVAEGLVLAGEPAGRVGSGRLGESSRLGDGAVDGRARRVQPGRTAP
jgi:phage tail-like protein